jgi:hypothetical protein
MPSADWLSNHAYNEHIMNIQKIARETFQQWANEGRFLVIAWVARDTDSTRLLELATIMQTCCPDAYLAQIDLDEAKDLGAMFAITAAPALLIMREKIGLYCAPGLPEPHMFRQLIERAAGLNMAAIHEELQREKEAEVALNMRRVCPAVRRQK